MALVNRLTTVLFDICFAPFVRAPGWLSLITFSVLTAAAGLLVYKYTSNQTAITRTKDRIKANILAIKLFRDDLGVIASSLARVCWHATAMLRFAALPLIIMIVPFVLVMAQLGLRYQWRPLLPSETVVLTAQLADAGSGSVDDARLETSGAVVVDAGPLRIPSEGRVMWRLRGADLGDHRLRVRIGEEVVGKSLVVGDGYDRVSRTRSGRDFWSSLLQPAEASLPRESALMSVSLAYPRRESWFCGADYWLIWLVVLSFVVAFLLKPVFRVEF